MGIDAGGVEAVVFDVDGTLVDSNYEHTLAWTRAFREAGVRVPTWRLHRHVGMGGDQLVEAVAGADVERGLGDRVRELEKQRYRELIEEIPPFPGAKELTKPDPDLIEVALQKAGTRSAVMVGDSVWDVVAAERAGIPTLGLLTGGFSRCELDEAGAAVVFESLEELQSALADGLLPRGGHRPGRV